MQVFFWAFGTPIVGTELLSHNSQRAFYAAIKRHDTRLDTVAVQVRTRSACRRSENLPITCPRNASGITRFSLATETAVFRAGA